MFTVRDAVTDRTLHTADTLISAIVWRMEAGQKYAYITGHNDQVITADVERSAVAVLSASVDRTAADLEGSYQTPGPRKNPTAGMNAEIISYYEGGLFDDGIRHRAISVARALWKAGAWDGQNPITIYNPCRLWCELDSQRKTAGDLFGGGADYLIRLF